MPDPIMNRLNADFAKVKGLIENSGDTLKLLRTHGVPPKVYAIEYHCPGLVKTSGGQLTVKNQHQVEINLGANYPFEKPTARMLTAIFNPHVFPNSSICLGGVWNPAETLDTLILRIGALIQLDPKVLNANSPANYDANQWVRQHRNRLPLGRVTFMAPAQAQKRIEWG